MPIEDGFVGMVDRDVFDEWLRDRAARAGAVRQTGTFEKLVQVEDGLTVVEYRCRRSRRGRQPAASARGR